MTSAKKAAPKQTVTVLERFQHPNYSDFHTTGYRVVGCGEMICDVTIPLGGDFGETWRSLVRMEDGSGRVCGDGRINTEYERFGFCDPEAAYVVVERQYAIDADATLAAFDARPRKRVPAVRADEIEFRCRQRTADGGFHYCAQ